MKLSAKYVLRNGRHQILLMPCMTTGWDIPISADDMGPFKGESND